MRPEHEQDCSFCYDRPAVLFNFRAGICRECCDQLHTNMKATLLTERERDPSSFPKWEPKALSGNKETG